MRDLRGIDWGRIADVTIVVSLLAIGFGELAWGSMRAARSGRT